MPEHEDFYTPEHVDEQVEALRQTRGMPSRDQRLASDLQSILETTDEDATSLQRVLQKLKQNDTTPQQQGRVIPLADWRSNQQERFAPMDKPMKRTTTMRPATRVLSTIAAGLVIVVIVGSLIAVLNARQQKQPGSTTGGPKTTIQKPAASHGQIVYRSKAFPYIYQSVLSPVGNRVVVLVEPTNNNQAKVQSWDTLTGQHVLTYITTYVIQVAWSPDGTQLAVVSDTKVYVFNAQTTQLLHTFTAPAIALSSTGTSSLSAFDTTQRTPFNSLSGGYRGFIDATWSSDGKELAAGFIGTQSVVSVWDTNTGAVLKTLANIGSSVPTSLQQVSWSPAGHQLALIGDENFETLVYDTTTWQVVRKFPSTVALAWSPDGKQLALLEPTGPVINLRGKDVRIVDVQSGQTVKRFAETNNVTIGGIHWSPDGTRVALEATNTKTNRDEIDLWSVASGTRLFQFTENPHYFSASWSADSKYLSTIVDDPKDANQTELVIWKA